MRRIVGFVLLVLLAAGGVARADQVQDERAIRHLGDVFAHAFVTKNATIRASIFADDATLRTPAGVFLVGRNAMVHDFGPEANALVTKTTTMAFSDYRFRFYTPDRAFVDTTITVRNVKKPDGALLAKGLISVGMVAVRRAAGWFIEDERSWNRAPADQR